MFCSSKFVVGSSNASIPQFKQNVSASAIRMIRDAKTLKNKTIYRQNVIFHSENESVAILAFLTNEFWGRAPFKEMFAVLKYSEFFCTNLWKRCTVLIYHLILRQNSKSAPNFNIQDRIK